jgi:hypothetical protein
MSSFLRTGESDETAKSTLKPPEMARAYERKRKVEKTLIAAITLLALTLAGNASAEPEHAKDRFDEFIALSKAVPHERLKMWPVGDGTGMELLVKRGTTDEQLAKLVRWYVGQANARVISIFDIPHTPPGGGGNAVMAHYADGTLIRFLYRHSDEEDLIGQRTIELPPQKTE